MTNHTAICSVTNENFEQILTSVDGLVLFKFWAPWCFPCRQLEPVVRDWIGRRSERMILAKVNIDMCIDIAKRFNVRAVPTLLLVKSGQEVTRLTAGSYTLDQLQQELGSHL